MGLRAEGWRGAILNFKLRHYPSSVRGLAPTFAGMDRSYWQRKLQEAEAELDAARTRTEVNAAAKKLQRAKAELRALEDVPADRPKRRPSRGSRSAAASS